MPNWVQNKIIFDDNGDTAVAALIRKLKELVETDESEFDFNKLIPMPETLDIESGTHQDWAIAYYVTDRLTKPVEETNLAELISNRFDADWANTAVARLKKLIKTDSITDLDKLYEEGKQYCYNREHYGFYTWYDWCCCNWGTKWNSSEAYWCFDNRVLYFQTAWSAPFPVIEAMAEKYPELNFTHQWADEDIGNNCGEMWYSEGVGSNIDIGDNRAFALRIWGYTEDDFD